MTPMRPEPVSGDRPEGAHTRTCRRGSSPPFGWGMYVFGNLCRGGYNKKRNLGSQPYSLVILPTKFFVGGFTGGHWFITSP